MNTADPTPARSPGFDVLFSRHLMTWLQEQRTSLAFTTYHSNRLFLVGTKADGNLSVF